MPFWSWECFKVKMPKQAFRVVEPFIYSITGAAWFGTNLLKPTNKNEKGGMFLGLHCLQARPE
eukprot:c12230_g1_i1 orf=205-393(+)